MRVILASGQDLLSGWLIAATIPLLIDPHTIAAWFVAGLGDRSRVGLASVELFGAALFAFELSVVAGFALLLAWHYEILLRVQRPDGDVTSIAGFLDAAERYQLLERLDSWVLAHVLTMLAPSVQKLCAVGASFAVNITGQSLSQPAFADFVRTKIKLHDIPAGLLDFELTETAAVRNLNATRRFISRMAEIGAHVALDDFGTGLSSLMHLKDLDVHRIKIDGKFVRDVLSNARSRALIRALVQIADDIGLETVAEFVETEDVASRVRELGVQCAQGYFYGRPRPLTETLRDLVAIHQEDPSDLPEYRAVGLR